MTRESLPDEQRTASERAATEQSFVTVTVADLILQLQLAAANGAAVKVLTDEAVERITAVSLSHDYKTVYILSRRSK